jgi:hypothetical protein
LNANPYKSAALVRRSRTFGLSNPALISLLQGVLAKGSRFRFHAKGDSMSPFIRSDDLITIAPLSSRTPRVGDIVAFVRPQTHQLVVHRIIGKDQDGFLVQGDNDSGQRDQVLGQNILGCVVKIERAGKEARLGLGPTRFLIPWLQRARLFHVLTALYGFLRSLRIRK